MQIKLEFFYTKTVPPPPPKRKPLQVVEQGTHTVTIREFTSVDIPIAFIQTEHSSQVPKDKAHSH